MKIINALTRVILPILIISLPFGTAALITDLVILKLLTLIIAIGAGFIYLKKLHHLDFDPTDKYQKAIFCLVAAGIMLFSFFLCAVSIEDEWVFDYPLTKPVDSYGCYPQTFDAFQKGQLNIDTDYDLSVLEKLENPYNTAERRAATGEKFGVLWDRAYYEGKIYSYFGVAPIFLVYYPFYFLTGHIPSDALAAAIIVAATVGFMFSILWELCKRLPKGVPFLLMLLGGATLPCGALLWSTLTCANFYHLAVLFGILAVCAFFCFVLKAEGAPDGFKRRIYFALSGASVAVIVASRPNLALYVLIALPLLISVIINYKTKLKKLFLDITAFCLPMLALGGLIMAYNAARFSSPFDFGSTYQLTLTDTSTYSFSLKLLFPSLYHFFISAPKLDDIFPFLHPAVRRFSSYGVDRLVYVSHTVGSVFFPASWGCFGAITLRKNKKALFTGGIALLCVLFIAFFDTCFGGVHLRYAADVMFILTIMGVYLLISLVARQKKGSAGYIICYTVVGALLLATVLIELPLCLDNERDMVLKFHREFYNMLAM